MIGGLVLLEKAVGTKIKNSILFQAYKPNSSKQPV